MPDGKTAIHKGIMNTKSDKYIDKYFFLLFKYIKKINYFLKIIKIH